MKGIIRAFALCAGCLLLGACDDGSSVRIGVIDMNILMKESIPGKAAQKFIEEREKELQANFDSIQEKLEKDPNNEKVLQELQMVYATSQQRIQGIGQSVVATLFDGIQSSLQTFREKNNYAILLRAEALEAYEPGLDVTRQALSEVNKLNLEFKLPAEKEIAAPDAGAASPDEEAVQKAQESIKESAPGRKIR